MSDDKKPEERSPTDWASYWGKEISAAKRWMQRFHTNGERIEGEYMARPTSGGILSDTGIGGARYNIFWANVQVTLSAIYSKLPVPEVDRTNLDQNDDVARVAGNILERIFHFELKNLEESPDNAYRDAIKDRFVAGMGQVWPRYEFEEQNEVTPAIKDETTGAELAPEVHNTIVTNEMVPLDYVRWTDFLYSPCRTWEVRRWVARRVYMSKEEALDRFGEVIIKDMSFRTINKSPNPDDPLKITPEPQAEVYEIWDKLTQHVFWYSKGSSVILDAKPDPLKLKGFFPCKRPIMATTITAAYLPRPDYAMVQDQYEELNLLSSRMGLLTQALKVVGVYDKTAEGVQRMLNQATMNQLIPVDNWAMFAEKGGIKGQVDWMPIDMVVNALDKMTLRKQSLIQEIYEILGLSDIMRGQSVATETATAQQLKAQYGSARMQTVQQQVSEFITSNTRTRAEIICKHWQPETILERSQIMNTPDKNLAQQAIALLKTDPSVAFRLTVQSDTIAAPDWNQEKQQRIDFLQAISQFIGMSMPLIEKDPGAGKYLMQMMQWAATGFKAGKQIEGVLDQAVAALEQSLMAPKPPAPPPPKDVKDTASAKKYNAEAKQTEAETVAGLAQAGMSPEGIRRMMSQGLQPPGVQAPPGQGGPGRPPGTALPQPNPGGPVQ